MSTVKRFLIVLKILLLISAVYFSSINAYTIKSSVDKDAVDLSSDISGLDDEKAFTHLFCYIKSGEVDHHCPYEFWKDTFFGILIKIGTGVGTFGIGSLYMHLTGKDNELRLKVSNIFRTITYTEDVNVSVKGFIGIFQPTGGISDGLLYGYSLLTRITPL